MLHYKLYHPIMCAVFLSWNDDNVSDHSQCSAEKLIFNKIILLAPLFWFARIDNQFIFYQILRSFLFLILAYLLHRWLTICKANFDASYSMHIFIFQTRFKVYIKTLCFLRKGNSYLTENMCYKCQNTNTHCA